MHWGGPCIPLTVEVYGAVERKQIQSFARDALFRVGFSQPMWPGELQFQSYCNRVTIGNL